jgi:predicted nucleic acid-binding protein
MASPARTRSTSGKAASAKTTLRLVFDGTEVLIDPETATIRDRWRGKEALRALNLPSDDSDLWTAALIWVIATRDVPDLTLDDVLDTVTLGDLGDGIEENDRPEA